VKWLRRTSFAISSAALVTGVVGQFSTVFVGAGNLEIQIVRGWTRYVWQPQRDDPYKIHFLPPSGQIFGHTGLGWDVPIGDIPFFPSLIGSRHLDVPHWLATLITWSLFFILWRKGGKHPKGHCQQCGYDLRLNESGRCPECNVEITV